jgi:hypothetical protein
MSLPNPKNCNKGQYNKGQAICILNPEGIPWGLDILRRTAGRVKRPPCRLFAGGKKISFFDWTHLSPPAISSYMNGTETLQGRLIRPEDVDWIRCLLRQHPDWHRTRLSREIAQAWQWRDATGRLKDMACRTLLLKLERRGEIQLPARRRAPVNHRRAAGFEPVLHDTSPIEGPLAQLRSIRLIQADSADTRELWQTLLSAYHYLGFSTCVGQSIRYLAVDRHQRPVGCLLFGAAAWTMAARDTFIGWNHDERKANLHKVLNNMRFLIPPWVRVPHLASHLLGLAAHQLPQDWAVKYVTPVHLLETFVDTERFRGTCYKAANWRFVGQTTGRTRNDRYTSIHQPQKAIYVYPLHRHFRALLTQSKEPRQ